MRKILLVIERDIKMFLSYRFLLIMRALWFIAQFSLFGLIASRMVIMPNYFQYYAAGVTIIILYTTAMFIGYDIYEEAEHGIVEYLLSLPLSRKELAIGRSIGGGLRSFIYVGPLMAVTLAIIGISNPLNFLAAFLSLFLFSFGVAGMSITFAMGIKSADKFDILMGVIDALIVRLSTVMYPKAFIQQANPFYAGIADFNPITFASDIFRWGAGVERYLTSSPLVAVLAIILFFSFFTFVGVAFYEKKLEGGGWQ
jgi:ABC-2 type transport system permease protein